MLRYIDLATIQRKVPSREASPYSVSPKVYLDYTQATDNTSSTIVRVAIVEVGGGDQLLSIFLLEFRIDHFPSTHLQKFRTKTFCRYRMDEIGQSWSRS